MSTTRNVYRETEEEAKNAKASYSPVIYSTGPVLKDYVTELWYFTLETWSLD